MGSFGKGQLDQFPIGSVIQSPINLEAVTNGQWIALDGRDANRSDYPLLSPYFPAGVFTSTARTLAAAPAVAVIAVNDYGFIAAAAAGVNPLQGSADSGATWGWSGSWGASSQVNSMCVSGSGKIVMAGSAGDFTAPYVANSSSSNTSKANWTATTGGTTTSLTQGLAYSSSLGRTVLCKNGSLATASGLFYMNDGATAWNACSGGSTADRKGVVWTGQRFIAAVQGGTNLPFTLQTSSDGITWSDSITQFSAYSSVSSLASDGNGTVVVYVRGQIGLHLTDYFIVSKDHGLTWRIATPPFGFDPYISPMTYVNNRFVMCGESGQSWNFAVSADGISWTVDPILNRGAMPVGVAAPAGLYSLTMAYKAGVYAAVGNTTFGMTATENMSKFFLPPRMTFDNGTVTVAQPQMMFFIKARN